MDRWKKASVAAAQGPRRSLADARKAGEDWHRSLWSCSRGSFLSWEQWEEAEGWWHDLICILTALGRLYYSISQGKEINQLGGCCSDPETDYGSLDQTSNDKINIQKIHVDSTRCQYCAMSCAHINSWNSHKQHVAWVFFTTFYI